MVSSRVPKDIDRSKDYCGGNKAYPSIKELRGA
jgi:hypothetical protein